MPTAGADIRVEGATVRCLGPWTVQGIGRVEALLEALAWPDAREIVLDGSGVEALDTAGIWLVARAVRDLERRGRAVAVRLRPEHEGLLRMVSAPEVAGGPAPPPPRLGPLARIGRRAVEGGAEALGILAFLGETALAAARLLTRPRRIRWRPILHNLQSAGFEALPIVGLLSFLLGVVIAYQGAVQLQRYGASIFVADLVGLAMLRELSPLLTAIIVAGRSGSAFAAQIGTMKVTEEIDALRTVGIVPADLLVLPKIAALAIALPLLTVYADGMGLVGGMVMARSELGVGAQDFLERLGQALVLSDYLVGVGKAPVFAAIIAVVGCFQGFRVAGDAESVGRRTTVSVVQSIFLVIVVDAAFSVVFSWLGI
ncbi:MAG TPA: MlaE family lipid ABC transporter permease subunit [Anaeromyxobacteraceae bacterium]|nr:MlaE family lipid ABC transporter permease subunit [Anaeromyxobacteraceae bacterium]